VDPRAGLGDMKKRKFLKNAVFWDVASCRSCEMEELIASIFRVEKSASEERCYLLTLVPRSRIFLP
jgi:hypothetical protein